MQPFDPSRIRESLVGMGLGPGVSEAIAAHLTSALGREDREIAVGELRGLIEIHLRPFRSELGPPVVPPGDLADRAWPPRDEDSEPPGDRPDDEPFTIPRIPRHKRVYFVAPKNLHIDSIPGSLPDQLDQEVGKAIHWISTGLVLVASDYALTAMVDEKAPHLLEELTEVSAGMIAVAIASPTTSNPDLDSVQLPPMNDLAGISDRGLKYMRAGRKVLEGISVTPQLGRAPDFSARHPFTIRFENLQPADYLRFARINVAHHVRSRINTPVTSSSGLAEVEVGGVAVPLNVVRPPHELVVPTGRTDHMPPPDGSLPGSFQLTGNYGTLRLSVSFRDARGMDYSDFVDIPISGTHEQTQKHREETRYAEAQARISAIEDRLNVVMHGLDLLCAVLEMLESLTSVVLPDLFALAIDMVETFFKTEKSKLGIHWLLRLKPRLEALNQRIHVDNMTAAEALPESGLPGSAETDPYP